MFVDGHATVQAESKFQKASQNSEHVRNMCVNLGKQKRTVS